MAKHVIYRPFEIISNPESAQITGFREAITENFDHSRESFLHSLSCVSAVHRQGAVLGLCRLS